jgi:DNA-binding ferritin-like protein (Dps family)
MTKEEFFILFGKDPEDVLGPDWEEFIEEFLKKKDKPHA